MTAAFPYDIFISYSQKDRPSAEKLQAALEARDLKFWRDERLADSPAESYMATINAAHDRAKRVVVLWHHPPSRAPCSALLAQEEKETVLQARNLLPSHPLADADTPAARSPRRTRVGGSQGEGFLALSDLTSAIGSRDAGRPG